MTKEKDEAALKKIAQRRKDAEAAKGGKKADSDTRKAIQALTKLFGSK